MSSYIRCLSTFKISVFLRVWVILLEIDILFEIIHILLVSLNFWMKFFPLRAGTPFNFPALLNKSPHYLSSSIAFLSFLGCERIFLFRNRIVINHGSIELWQVNPICTRYLRKCGCCCWTLISSKIPGMIRPDCF